MDLWVENTADIEHTIKARGFPLADSACCPLALLHFQVTTEHTLQGRLLGLSSFSQWALLPDSQPHPQACSSRPSCEEGAAEGQLSTRTAFWAAAD